MKTEKEFDYMNVVPLVDVILVLLTIVLTTSTFIATGAIPVELPSAARSPVEPLKNQVIEIARSGKLYLNAKPSNLQALRVSMTTVDRQTPILIRADKNLKLQEFVDVLDLLKSMGFKAVSLQTEAKP